MNLHTVNSKNTNGTHIGHLNVYYLPNKIADVSVLLNNKPNMHILGLSETKIKHTDDHITDDILSIPNYRIVRRNAEYQGETGLAVYIHHSIKNNIKRRKDLEPTTVECIWFEIKYAKSTPFLVGFIYRNPAFNSDWFEPFSDMMDTVHKEGRSILLLGDLNFDLLKRQAAWEATTTLFGLKQLVEKATRITNKTETLLDHIYTNNKSLVTNVRVYESGISDHFPTICTWLDKPPKMNKAGHTTIHYRSFRHFNKLHFCHDLSLANFHEVINFQDPNKALDCFYEALIPIINKHAPLRQKRVKESEPPWVAHP